MSAPDILKNNVERFSGFADCYDANRPAAPPLVVEILCTYLGRKPSSVVDAGCGTGLSTFLWQGNAGTVLGVEPNEDMLAKARERLAASNTDGNLSFVQGYSNQLPVESHSVDVITCSQSFHWMEPKSTLEEFSRVLVNGGIFAAYDCDWPPSVNWQIEKEYQQLVQKAEMLFARYIPAEDRAYKWDKNGHLKNIRESGKFRFAREIVFHNIEPCNAGRFVGLALSQGQLQTIFKAGATELQTELDSFAQKIGAYFAGATLDVLFSYRMRLGIK